MFNDYDCFIKHEYGHLASGIEVNTAQVNIGLGTWVFFFNADTEDKYNNILSKIYPLPSLYISTI